MDTISRDDLRRMALAIGICLLVVVPFCLVAHVAVNGIGSPIIFAAIIIGMCGNCLVVFGGILTMAEARENRQPTFEVLGQGETRVTDPEL